MRRWCWLLLSAGILVGCRSEDAPEAVAVREDGALQLALCSFNIRYEGDQDRGWRSWPNRVHRVVCTLKELDPDVFGIQEAQHGQAADLRASLSDYDFVGVGREDGDRQGEYTALFWKKKRFVLDPDEHGTFWLSDTPQVPGSRHWGNGISRIVTWARLADRSTGRSFYVYNTHWDHRSQAFRLRAAPALAARIDARLHPQDPVVLMGDFNAVRGNPAVDYLLGEPVKIEGVVSTRWQNGMVDPYQELNGNGGNRRTLHFWEADRGTRLNGLKVDHVFVSRGAELLGAGIAKAATRKTQPSDHYPVWVEVRWPQD